MTKQRVEIVLTKECLDTIEEAVTIDLSVKTVEEFIEKYSVLAAQEIIMNNKKG